MIHAPARRSCTAAVSLLLTLGVAPAGAAAASDSAAPASFTAAAAPALKADYRFQDTRTSSVPGAPALTDLAGTNAFATQTVDGKATRVLTFGANRGVQLAPALVPSGSYTIVVLAKLSTTSGYRRLVDVKHGTADTGLYLSGGSLCFYGGATAGSQPVKPGQFAQIALTRNAATRLVTGYVNGTKVLSFTDSTSIATIDGTNMVKFFRDNQSGGATNEASAGAVARIRLYSSPLTATQIKALDRAAA